MHFAPGFMHRLCRWFLPFFMGKVAEILNSQRYRSGCFFAGTCKSHYVKCSLFSAIYLSGEVRCSGAGACAITNEKLKTERGMNRIACALVVLLLAGCHSKPVKKDVPFDYGQLNADQKTYVNDMKAELTAIASKSVSTGNCNIVISQQAGGKIEAVYAQGGDPGVCEALIKAARSSSERKLPTKPPGMPESYRFEFKL